MLYLRYCYRGCLEIKGKEDMLKGFFKFLVILLVFAAIIGGVLWHYRYDIFQYSAEAIIRDKLPEYVHVDRIIFDLQNNILQVRGFAIKNPKGFEDKYLATIDTITAHYKMNGSNILDGIEVTSIEGASPVINIERRHDGRLNLEEMGRVMEADKKVQEKPSEVESKISKVFSDRRDIGGKTISDLVKLPEKINMTNGRIIFLDKVITPRGYRLSFDDFNGDIGLKLNDIYTKVLTASSQGRGFVDGDRSQRVDWIVAAYPQEEGLTMSNRFEVSNVDVMPFKPYYNRYSPVDITRGWFSGSLVFDFDHGNIGSTNVVRLSGLRFTEQRNEGEASGIWDMSISDFIQYLQSSSGDIIVDFKIKGSLQNPRFYPGPRLKQAMQSLAIDTVSKLLTPQDQVAEQGVAGAAKTDAEQIVDAVRQLMNR